MVLRLSVEGFSSPPNVAQQVSDKTFPLHPVTASGGIPDALVLNGVRYA